MSIPRHFIKIVVVIYIVYLVTLSSPVLSGISSITSFKISMPTDQLFIPFRKELKTALISKKDSYKSIIQRYCTRGISSCLTN